MLPYTGFFIPSAIGGGGVSGLATADGGVAIGNNQLIRGDGTTGIQGGLLTSADHNGDIAGPTTGSDTTAVGIAYTNQPSNDSVQILSSDAGDTAVSITIIGTTTGTDTVVVEVLATDATDGTTPVTSVKVNWGQILAIKKPVTLGTITIQKTTGPATVTTLLAAATSSGVSAASGTANGWNRTLRLVSDGATTKQVGIKGTNSSGTTIYDSQALTGTTVAYSNSAFVEVHEFYIGDLEGTRTLTASTRGGLGINDDLLLVSGADIRWSTDAGLARSAAGVLKVTDGSSGSGGLVATSIDSGAATNLLLKYNNSTALTLALTDITAHIDFAMNGNRFKGAALAVEANTAGSGSPNLLAANSDGLKLITNEGSTAKNYHTLPAANGGYSLQTTLYVQDADGIRITAGAGDTIRVLDKVTAAAGYIESTTIGSYVTLQDINATEWVAIGIGGVWTDGTFTFDNTGLTSP